jgi:hypothetical protein
MWKREENEGSEEQASISGKFKHLLQVAETCQLAVARVEWFDKHRFVELR